jgi:hypothetical protein
MWIIWEFSCAFAERNVQAFYLHTRTTASNWIVTMASAMSWDQSSRTRSVFLETLQLCLLLLCLIVLPFLKIVSVWTKSLARFFPSIPMAISRYRCKYELQYVHLFVLFPLALNSCIMLYQTICNSVLPCTKFLWQGLHNIPLWDRAISLFLLIQNAQPLRSGRQLPETLLAVNLLPIPEKKFQFGQYQLTISCPLSRIQS